MPVSTAGRSYIRYQFTAPIDGFERILTPEAIDFLTELHTRFAERVDRLLEARTRRQQLLDAGQRPDFLEETRHTRESEWRIDPAPQDLRDRRVEMAGPPERKTLIDALSSGAKVCVADFEDAHAPSWRATLEGQMNVFDAVRRQLELTSPAGRRDTVDDRTPVLMVRPRGWHLYEKHFLVTNRPMPAALFDFGLAFFHNARELLARGSGPYFYLPKLENHREARLWNDVFLFAQQRLGLPRGTIKATVLIETILAAFEMDEILYELRHHATGLQCGRWDYIFSFIKRFRNDGRCVLPDRDQITMTAPFLRSYSRLLIKTCHRRGAHAMGGMAAQIPVEDGAGNEIAFATVRADKEREVRDGHDGTWVAHPALVPIALEVFDRHMHGPNQIHRLRDDVQVHAHDLLAPPEGTITARGLRGSIGVALRYMAAWLGGRGTVPIDNVMADAATAEIARAQIWQWIRHPRGVLDDGRKVTLELFRILMAEELNRLRERVGAERFDRGHYQLAARLLDEITASDRFVEFFTAAAYGHLD